MFDQTGWCKFYYDPNIAHWAKAARREGCFALRDNGMREKWLQCKGTWFVGVDALPSGATRFMQRPVIQSRKDRNGSTFSRQQKWLNVEIIVRDGINQKCPRERQEASGCQRRKYS